MPRDRPYLCQWRRPDVCCAFDGDRRCGDVFSKLSLPASISVVVKNYSDAPQIKRDILFALGNEYCWLANRMGHPQFVEDVRILLAHFTEDEIGTLDRMLDILNDRLRREQIISTAHFVPCFFSTPV